MKAENIRKISMDILVDMAGGILIAAGTYNFASHADFPMVGVNGIALILYHLFGLPIGLMVVLMNIPIVLVCGRILSRGFFLRSLKSILITSFIMDAAAPLFPVYHGDTLLAALCTGTCVGFGFALIFMRGSSTGGMDFVVHAIKAKMPHLALGKIIFALDIAVVVIGTALISKNVDGLIYGAIVSFLISLVVDKVMYGMDSGKVAVIITEMPEMIVAKIDEIVGRGATYLKIEGSFSRKEQRAVMCACSKKQMYDVQMLVKEADSKAFMVIMESNEVMGEGFK